MSNLNRTSMSLMSIRRSLSDVSGRWASVANYEKWANISLPHLEGIISKSHHSIHLFSTTYSYHKVVSINSV